MWIIKHFLCELLLSVIQNSWTLITIIIIESLSRFIKPIHFGNEKARVAELFYTDVAADVVYIMV